MIKIMIRESKYVLLDKWYELPHDNRETDEESHHQHMPFVVKLLVIAVPSIKKESVNHS